MTVPSAAKDRPAVTTEVPARRFWLASPATALVLGGLVLTLLAAGWPLGAMARADTGSTVVSSLVAVALGALGAVVAGRQPRNLMGWILLGSAGFIALNNDASFYTALVYRLGHKLPLGPVAVLVQPSWAPAIVLFGLAVLLFPDGRAPSPRWHWVLAVYLAVGVLWMAGTVVFSAGAIISRDVHVDSGGNLLVLAHPTGGAAWWGVVQNLFFLLLGVFWLASLGSQAVSYRRSAGERRQQLKWLMSGAVVAVIGLAVSVSFGSETHGIPKVLAGVGFAGIAALPVCIGVGILKYRLFDIDRLISRTLAYAIVTGLLVRVYAGLVLLATRALSAGSQVAVAASTLAAAALFNPLRRRVQRGVDRRFNRARYDADRTVAAFAARLKDAVDLDSVRADLAGVVHQALEPAHVSVWVKGGGR
ncbi:MAG TPA: hypothetical protein VGA04_26230 [Streptosporangiaceae bacterium]